MRAICYFSSALTLFVLGVLANHPVLALAPDDLALFADFLDRGSDFHGFPLETEALKAAALYLKR
jgi:hypothetical protein